jgi:hypothetical protein
MAAKRVRIGSGAGFAGDRWEPAVELVERGGLDYIAFECLAERTIARETLGLRRGRGRGYNPQLEDRMRAVLPAAAARGVDTRRGRTPLSVRKFGTWASLRF